MKKLWRILMVVLAHIWNSIHITVVSLIFTIPLTIQGLRYGDFEGVREWWTEKVPELCERQNRLYSIYLKTGEIDHSIFGTES